ncbi:hypothetical protein BJ165DRAFT_866261 [Panaeolus papilionaceus]|nr:hypothetical protein BJ165DRAFT_866261 [Panaeolus papilionaceus]
MLRPFSRRHLFKYLPTLKFSTYIISTFIIISLEEFIALLLHPFRLDIIDRTLFYHHSHIRDTSFIHSFSYLVQVSLLIQYVEWSISNSLYCRCWDQSMHRSDFLGVSRVVECVLGRDASVWRLRSVVRPIHITTLWTSLPDRVEYLSESVDAGMSETSCRCKELRVPLSAPGWFSLERPKRTPITI